MIIEPYLGKFPRIDQSAYLSENAVIVGDVEIAAGCSIWYGSVVRGDVNYIRIGENTNVQDNSVLHVQHDTGPLIIGKGVTVGHAVNLHGCEIGDNCLIGIGAIVLTGAKVGSNCIIAAGALIKENAVIPEGSLVAGIPGVIKKNLAEKEIASIAESASNYMKYVENFRKGGK